MAEKPSRLSPVAFSRVALGVRYEPQWKLLDYIGELIDLILRSERTPFGPEVFPQSSSDASEHILLNPEKGYLLRVNQHDAVLEWKLDTRNLEDVAALARQFDEFVLGPLRTEVGLSDIFRYGLLFRMKQQSGLKNSPLNHYLAADFPTSSLTSLGMRFTRRLPSAEAMWRKNVEDFRSVIYIVEESEEGEVQLSLDYQEYFKPLLDTSDWSKRPYTVFADKALEYFEHEGSKWLKSFTETPAAVA